MFLLEYIYNLSVFGLLVSTSLIIRSFTNHKPLKQAKILVGLYAGIVSVILVALSFQQNEYSYDIRYAPIVLVYAYLGPIAGSITGSIALLARLFFGGHWLTAIIGWLIVMSVFIIVHKLVKHLSPVKRVATIMASYVLAYTAVVPILFNVFRDKPLFHVQYLLFVLLGVIVGTLLIESYEMLYRTIAEKKRIEKTLAESESQYRLIAENTSDLIMVMKPDHSVSYYSPSHQAVLEYSVSELVETKLCSFIHPDDKARFKEAMNCINKVKEPQTVEYRFKHRNGHWIQFESRCMPVTGENHSIEHIVIVSRDVTERKKAEELLLRSEKLSVVGELAAGIAHEIRNPLTTIKGFIQLYKTENPHVQYNELLLSELARIERITSELLSLGKPQAVELTHTDIRELVIKTLELLSPQANLNGIQFEVNSEEKPYFVLCEKNQMLQVFLNLFKNAMESMPKGGEITVNFNQNLEGKYTISIQDQGCGIPKELLPRLGEPFYTLKEKGTGLGLMICHKIIRDHQGTIEYQSKEGQGTKVNVVLPIATI
ncbi:ATP-binding protein [Fredinandcohnia sp. 179-A 10B2 NHS]|uniref:ATP-binding protein n=1 Tax=Fredinandcohnia sp. 179-A 10B2 NHS TaxID=3235176 RepID=UPI0039A1A986